MESVAPSEANWYWEVTFSFKGEFGPETDYIYGYTKDEITPEQRKLDFEAAYPQLTVLQVMVQATNSNNLDAVRRMFGELD
jgi:hypothetical protein